MISSDRRDFYQWLASRLSKKSEPVIASPFGRTLFLTGSELDVNPERLSLLLERYTSEASSSEKLDLLILDLTDNPFQIIREPLIYQLCLKVVIMIESNAMQRVLLFLPQLPSDYSYMWSVLTSIDHGEVMVLDRNGNYKSFGSQLWSPSNRFALSLRRAQSKIVGDPRERFRRKLLRKVGHFRKATPGRITCSRYFYDASLATEELTALLQQAIRGSMPSQIRRPALIAVHAPMSAWMLETAVGVSTELGLRSAIADVSTSGVPSDVQATWLGKRVVLLVDLVHEGRAAREGLERLIAAGTEVQPVVFAAMSSGLRDSIRVGGRTFRVHAIHQVSHAVVPESDCSQCQLGLRWGSHDDEAYFSIPPYDFWDIALEADWISERDVPPGRDSLGLTPDWAAVFRTYGDWLAYKVGLRLRSLGLGDDIVLVCPAEDGALAILDHLRARFNDRPVSIMIPRGVLAAIADAHSDIGAVVDSLPQEHLESWWIRQLRYVADRHGSVVMIDEFTASGGTAQSLRRLLGYFGVSIAIYIPMINRIPRMNLNAPFPVHSVYELESPRASVPDGVRW